MFEKTLLVVRKMRGYLGIPCVLNSMAIKYIILNEFFQRWRKLLAIFGHVAYWQLLSAIYGGQ